MLRHRVGRFCATLLLLWFAVLSGAPSVLHACPIHDSVATAADEHSAHSHQAPDGTTDGACTCIGDCATSGVAPGLAAAPASFAAGATREIDTPSLAPYTPAVARPAFVLPYANGPPGSVHVV